MVCNKGLRFMQLGPTAPPKLQSRGYALEKLEMREMLFDKPGSYKVRALVVCGKAAGK